ncbi:hypothetical protein MKEN_00522700 [Mycena kentingensis (nom. inval.)]|nr:hypothetical protein MKEN_00522700 [Mycena kentingensis (nom. inval.)]
MDRESHFSKIIGQGEDQERYYADLLALGDNIIRSRAWTEVEKKIRCRDELQLPVLPASSSSGSTKEERANKTFSSFKATYLGNQDQVLLATIDCYVAKGLHIAAQPTETLISPCAAFIQASCTGKTRTVLQICSRRPGLYLNIREESQDQLAFPPADGLLRDFLLEKLLKKESFKVVRKRMAAFLGAVMEVCNQQVQEQPAAALSTFAASWHSSLNEEMSLMDTSDKKKLLVKEIIAVARRIEKECKTWEDAAETASKRCATLLASIAERTTSPTNLKSTKATVEFLLILDEAHTLANLDAVDPEQEGKRIESGLDALERVLRFFAQYPIFVIFLSTTSKLDKLATDHRKLPSFRETLSYANHAVITETVGFDLHAKKTIEDLTNSDGGLTLSKIRDPQLAVSFGRPIWRALYDASDDDPESKLSPALKLALNKMKHWREDDSGDESFPLDAEQTAVLAWLSQRLLLPLDITRPRGRALAQELTESYMRMVMTITHDRERMVTNAPSEPTLNEAAAQLCAKMDAKIVATTFENAHTRNFVARGERGENVSRFLQVDAHDRVNGADFKSLTSEKLIYHRPVRLLEWLKKLVKSQVWAGIRDVLPHNNTENALTLQDAFCDAFIFTSHFSEAADETVIQLENLGNFFLRGTALQCKPGQEAVDSPFANLTKNRNQAKKLTPIPTTLIDPEGKSKLPFLNIVLELGVEKEKLWSSVKSPTKRCARFKNCDAPVYEIVLYFGALDMSPQIRETMKHVLDVSFINNESPRMEIAANRTLQNNLLGSHNVQNLTNWGLTKLVPPKLVPAKRSNEGDDDPGPEAKRVHGESADEGVEPGVEADVYSVAPV